MAIEDFNICEKNIPVREAYRALRVNVLYCNRGKDIRTLTITSCNPGEGKTTTAINLAITIAKSDKKVLYVDADLRKPSEFKQLGSDSKVGFSHLISGKAGLGETVNATDVENLYYIGSGEVLPNSAELLESGRFAELLQIFRKEYELTIFDTPPLGSVIDGVVVAAQTDGAILVIKSEASRLYNVQRAKEQLEKANVKLVGAILNDISAQEYKSYYNHYNYYGAANKGRGSKR